MKLTDFEVREGNMYEVMGEDSLSYSFDCVIVARDERGNLWQHKSFFPGSGHSDEEGFDYVISSRRNATEAMEVLMRSPVIKDYWELVPQEMSLEERFEQYAIEENIERHGLPF